MYVRIVLSTAEILHLQCDACTVVQELENRIVECVQEGVGFQADLFNG